MTAIPRTLFCRERLVSGQECYQALIQMLAGPLFMLIVMTMMMLTVLSELHIRHFPFVKSTRYSNTDFPQSVLLSAFQSLPTTYRPIQQATIQISSAEV